MALILHYFFNYCLFYFFIKLIKKEKIKIYIYYNTTILFGNTPKPYKIQGTNIIKATTIGNNTVQQKDINWSKRILGKLALTQIKVKIITGALIPNTTLEINPDEQLTKNKKSGTRSFCMISIVTSDESTFKLS